MPLVRVAGGPGEANPFCYFISGDNILMARITVEDCLTRMDNRFDMVLAAARRAHQLSNGVEPLIENTQDKPTVVALREIAAGLVGRDILTQEPEQGEISDDELAQALLSTMAEPPLTAEQAVATAA